MTAILSLSGVSVSFGGLMAVSDVSFDIHEGEILGIIGPNGAGKSTLFNAICGLIRLSDGSVRFQSSDITTLPPTTRMALGIQRTFQSVQLVKSMSVLENILLGMHRSISINPLRRGTKEGAPRDALAHARAIAALVGVGSVADIVVDHLSYREHRLTEIGRALASGPRLLLLDEPAAGLSEAEIRDLNALIIEIRAKLGVTVLLVEHVMPLVMGLCDRVAVLETGRLLTLGGPREVAADPRVISAYLGASSA